MHSTTKNKVFLLCIKAVKISIPIVFILIAWHFLHLITDNSFFVPSIRDTAFAMIKIICKNGFIITVLTSFWRVIAGLLIGSILGIISAFLCHYSDFLNALISPMMSIVKATPVACIIVILWIGMRNMSELAILIVLMMVMPIVWQNIYDGFKSIDNGLIEVSEVFELSAITRFKVLIFPSLTKYLIPALITSIGLAWKAEIAAEIMTYNNIGQLIQDFKVIDFDSASVFAWTIIIILLSLFFEKTAKYVLRRLANGLDN